MPKPSLQQIFGINAIVQGDDLTISKTDFTDVGWDDPFGIDDPEKWLTAIILKARKFSDANTDESPNVNVQEPYQGLTTRENQLKREYSYNVQVYVPDTGNTAPDPDLL